MLDIGAAVAAGAAWDWPAFWTQVAATLLGSGIAVGLAVWLFLKESRARARERTEDRQERADGERRRAVWQFGQHVDELLRRMGTDSFDEWDATLAGLMKSIDELRFLDDRHALIAWLWTHAEVIRLVSLGGYGMVAGLERVKADLAWWAMGEADGEELFNTPRETPPPD